MRKPLAITAPFLLAAALLLSGCELAALYCPYLNRPLEVDDPASVTITPQPPEMTVLRAMPEEGTYTRIATLKALPEPGVALDRLKKQAVGLGADALVVEGLSQENGDFQLGVIDKANDSKTLLQAEAIKYVKKQ